MALENLLRTFSDDFVIKKEEDGTYREKDADGISLRGVLQRGRLKLKRETTDYRPQGLTFRPSSITYSYCRRIKVAQLAGMVQLFDEPPAPRQQMVFDFGHAVHEIIQGYFWDIGILKGSYKCIKCDKVYDDLISPTSCPSDIKSHEKKHLTYKEVIYRDEEHLVNGRADGILIIEGKEHLMDIKTIANRVNSTPERAFCYEDLEYGPKEDHVIQLTLYMWISGIHRGHLLYVAKNDHKIKTFAIPYDFSVVEPYLVEIHRLIQLAEDIKKGNSVVFPPPCGKESCPCDTILGIAKTEG